MIRQSKIASELMKFENQGTYLEVQNSRIKMQVISSNTIKIGRKIKLSPEDIIIIVFLEIYEIRYKKGSVLQCYEKDHIFKKY